MNRNSKRTYSFALAALLALCCAQAVLAVGGDFTLPQARLGATSEPATALIPVAEERAIVPEIEGARRFALTWPGQEGPAFAYLVSGESVDVRVDRAREDVGSDLIYFDAVSGDTFTLDQLLSEDLSACRYVQLLAQGGESEACLAKQTDLSHPLYDVFFLRSEAELADLTARLAQDHPGLACAESADDPTAPANAYTIYVLDQYGEGVPGMIVNFCTDTACYTLVSDEDGALSYEGEPGCYHVMPLKAPEGYSFDKGLDAYTPEAYGTWALRIKKD